MALTLVFNEATSVATGFRPVNTVYAFQFLNQMQVTMPRNLINVLHWEFPSRVEDIPDTERACWLALGTESWFFQQAIARLQLSCCGIGRPIAKASGRGKHSI